MNPVKTERMEWLDAMRGFTMILVVAYHVSQSTFIEPAKYSTAMSLFVLFRMPLFFFVSGFLAYKANFLWTAKAFGSLTWKKIRIQILPTIVFLSIYIMLRGRGTFDEGLMRALHSPTKGGYWFTWTLLQMFIIYYVFAAIEYRCKCRSWIPITLLWFAALCVYATLYMPAWFTYHKADFYSYSSLIQTMQFFHFFLLGNIVRRYWDKWQKLFDSKWFYPTAVTVAFICAVDILRYHTLKGQWTNLPRTTAMYLLLLIVVMFFRHYKDWFTKERPVGRTLQYIGVRTLDIYLLHFIMLPKMPMVGEWFKEYTPNFVIDTTLSAGLGLLVIAFCCLTSNILRVSPLFRVYLFGRK